METFSSIGDLEAGIAEALEAIRAGVKLPEGLENLRFLAPPRGFIPKVSFRRAGDERKIRGDASPEHWCPEKAFVQIEFVSLISAQERLPVAIDAERPPGESMETIGEAQLRELVLTLDRAEHDRQAFRNFVALKTFRDSYLPQQGLGWAVAASSRHEALRQAIDRGWLLKSSVHNPKAPEFPVTAIKLNRSLPEVSKILEGNRRPSPFTPIHLPGEPLSRTVLQARR